MGLDSLRNIADMSGDPPGAPRQILDLVPGNRLENWEEIRNLRLEYDGPYLRLKRRGGTVAQRTFFGSINTIYPFSARINTVLKDFVAVHNTSGDIILWNVTDDTTSTVMTGFPTGQKIQITHSGIYLYGFSYDAGIAKYHDLEAGGEFNFLDYNRSYIESINYRSNPLTEENLWGFELDQQIIVFPNATWNSGVQIITSSDGDGQLDYNRYSVNSFRYVYNEGDYLIDSNGVEYKETRFFTFAPGDAPLVYTVGGSGSDFVIEQFYIPLNEDGDPAFESYVAKITSLTDQYIGFKDPTGVPSTAKIGDPSTTEDLTDRNLVFPYSPDLDDMVGRPANKILDSDGTSIIENGDYEPPSIYRGYLLLDVLNDGSVTIPGRPYELEADTTVLYQDGSTEVRFTASSPDSHVARRFLCATRWQRTKQNAFDPSSELYPNSPFFIIKEMDINKIFVDDASPDDSLIRPITEQASNMAGGIFDQFGPGEMLPHSVASFQGSLLTGGYQVNRPIPIPYTNPATATDENIYVNITPTTQLPNDMALAFQFEYPDGKRSNIVETEEFLQEGSTTETEPVACDQVKAFGGHEVQTGASYDGSLTVTYQGITIEVPLTAASHSAPADVAEAIRQAVVGSATIRITADVPSGAQVDYTEKRWGEEFNSNVVDIAHQVPWDIGGGSFVDSFSTGFTAIHGLTFNGDGTKMYVVRDSNDRVVSFTLSTPYDVSTASATGNILDVSTETNTPKHIVFNDDGTEIYVTGATNSVYQYTLTTAYDLTTASFTQSFSTATQTTTVDGLSFKADGTKMYVTDAGSSSVFAYDLGTAWDISTAAYNNETFDTSTQDTDPHGMYIKPDGAKMFIVGDQNDNVYEYDLGTAWDISTATFDVSFDVSGQDTTPLGIHLNNGVKMFMTGDDNDLVYEYDLPATTGVTFDTEDPSLSGGQEPEGPGAEIWVWMKDNNIPSGGATEEYYLVVQDDPDADVGGTSLTWPIEPGFSDDDAITVMSGQLGSSTQLTDFWDVSIETKTIEGASRTVVVLRGPAGDLKFNDAEFSITRNQTNQNVVFGHAAPGRTVDTDVNFSAGATEGCTQATASIDVDANNLGSGASEDHTINVDGNATSPITIADTDTLEGVVDKYLAEIQSTPAIDIDWKSEKVDNGDGTWRLLLTFRQYGTTGNSRSVSVSGDVDVTLVVTSLSSGGDDGGSVPVGSASEVNANRLQIHSLNLLVSKVFILGRTINGSTNFHLIEEVEISDPQAHGMVIELPNTESQLNDIEATTFTQPTISDVREQVSLQNYVNVGVPFQEFPISGQQSIQDQSSILRAMPLQFDVDKTQMRYKFLLVTDKNLQIAYLTDTGQGFNKDIETFYEGIRIKPGTRAGITLVENNRVIMHTEDGIKLFDQNQVRKLIDDREYDLVKSGGLKTAILSRTHNEYWMIFNSQEVLVWDLAHEKAVKTFSFDGPGISANVREGAYAHNNMIIAIGGDLCYTDLEGTHDDLGEGVANSHYINAQMISKHLGTPNTQKKILEVDVAGQTYNVQVHLDLQKERLESNTNTWDKAFTEDVSTSVEALDISGKSFQFHKRAIMPKIKVDLTGNGDGFISHATLKYLDFENRGKARI